MGVLDRLTEVFCLCGDAPGGFYTTVGNISTKYLIIRAVLGIFKLTALEQRTLA